MNNQVKKIAVIGAGGIACHLIPPLSLDYEIVLVDGDSFEPHNSTRQFPALQSTGNKAEVLAEMQKGRSNNAVLPIKTYLKGIEIISNEHWRNIDLIIGAVDNNQSRKLIIDLAEDQEVPAILCGNEVNMGEAHLYLPGVYDPFDFHDFGEMTPAPFSCTADENAESAPQTSTANFMAAASGLLILSSWLTMKKQENLTVHSIMDVRGPSGKARLKDVIAKMAES